MKISGMASAAALIAGLAASGAVVPDAMAQGAKQPAGEPKWAPPAPPVEAPKDVAYAAGTVRLTVDATDLDHRIFKMHEVVPVDRAGDFVLMLPKWLPGHHSPGTDIAKIANVTFTINGDIVPWTRDVVDINAFHINVPKGANEVTVDFDFLSATTEAAGKTLMTQDMLDLEWNFASFYPAGYYARRIPIQASVIFPKGWGYGTALETVSHTDDKAVFKPVDYDTLIDSPIYAGRYYRQIDLDPGAAVPVRLNIVADKPDLLNAPDDVIATHRKLIQQAYKLYGSHHYDHYDFLVSASSQLVSNGLEHHRSSEDGVTPQYFTDWKTKYVGRDLLAHEYTHSWDGKFRRPWDLWTPNFQVPMRDSLLWVYEGQTQYWGIMLAARSGLYSRDQALQYLAIIAASYDNLPGRSWRPMQDTTNDPVISSRSPQDWRSFQRSEDYYNEGLLIWLDADTLIREKTNGAKSLDDFARSFFGIDDGAWGEATYNFDDVVKALNAVYPYDWATFLRTRLDRFGQGQPMGAPLDGLARGGYKLTYAETPSDYYKAVETTRKSTNLSYSLGLSVSTKDSTITDVMWDGPAYKAGLAPGAVLVAVNGKAYDPDLFKGAVTAAKTSKDPIGLLIKVDDNYKTVTIDYHGGLRYPLLERIDGTPDRLGDIIAEKK